MLGYWWAGRSQRWVRRGRRAGPLRTRTPTHPHEEEEEQRIAGVGVDDQAGAEPEEGVDGGHPPGLEQLAVEVEGAAGGLVPGERAGGGGARGGGELGPGRRVAAELSEGGGERPRVPGRDQPGGAGRGDLGEAADGAEQQRLAEGEAGVEDAGVLGVEVGEGEEVGAAEDRRDLGVLDEAGDEANAAAGRGGQARAAARPPSGGCRRSTAPPLAPGRKPRSGSRSPCTVGAGRRRGSPDPPLPPAPRAAASPRAVGSGSRRRRGG